MLVPSLLRVNSEVPVALEFVGGTTSCPTRFAVKFCCPCANTKDGNPVYDGDIILVKVIITKRLKLNVNATAKMALCIFTNPL